MSHEKKKKQPLRFIIKLLVIIIISFVLVAWLASELLIMMSFSRVERAAAEDTTYTRYEDFADFPRTEVSFMSGKNKLDGYIYGNGNDKGLVVFVHGFGGGSDDYLSQYEYLVKKGWCVFAYDGTGVYGSEGSGRISFYQSTLDLAAALDYINSDSTLSKQPLALMGHSQGGFAVCSVLAYPEAANVKAVVGFAVPNGAGDIIKEAMEQLLGGFAPLSMPFITIADSADFGSKAVTAVEGINSTDVGVLLFQGTADEVVTPERTAVTHYRDDFTNPNVQVILCENEWDKSHESIVYSEDAYFYMEAVNEAYADYKTANGIEKATANDRRSFVTAYGFDKKKAREANSELFDTAEEFILNSFNKT
jgi:pimeloyl-ACP methyl ester carboxylesterase